MNVHIQTIYPDLKKKRQEESHKWMSKFLKRRYSTVLYAVITNDVTVLVDM